MAFELLNPHGLETPVGYSHVATITGGKIVHVAGQAPFDADGKVVGKGDFVTQFGQVMRNLKSAVEAAGLKLQSREAVPPFQFLLVFEKRDAVPATTQTPRRPS